MAAAAAPVSLVFLCTRGQQQLVLVDATKPPLPLRSRAFSVRAAQQQQQQQHRARPRPPRRNKPPGPARRPPRVPLDQDEYDGGYDDREEGRFAGGTRAAAMPKPPAGFVLNEWGRCIVAAFKCIFIIVRRQGRPTVGRQYSRLGPPTVVACRQPPIPLSQSTHQLQRWSGAITI